MNVCPSCWYFILLALVAAHFQKHDDQDRRQENHYEEADDENGAEIDEETGSHDENGEEIEEDHGSTSILSKVSWVSSVRRALVQMV